MENNKPEVTAIDILTMHSGLLPETIKASYSWVLSAMNEYGSRKVLEYQQSQPADETPSGSEAWVSGERPKIVCLCGSTKFMDAFIKANRDETISGKIVLSVGTYGHMEGMDMTSQLKKNLDELHKRKIDLADEVLVLNVGGYIGSSTRSEIDYAAVHNKPVRYLEPLPHPTNKIKE